MSQQNATLVLATHNQGKLAEMTAYLKDMPVGLRLAAEFGCAEPEEDGATFAENALIKARYVFKETGLPCLADDSGLCVEALDDAPGVHSARWAGARKDFPLAMQRVQEKLLESGIKPPYRARFVTVLALVEADGSEKLFEGVCEGVLAWPPRGDGGFGYDPMFVPEGDMRTFGEMSPEDKKRYSHRAQAVADFVRHYQNALAAG